MLDADSHMNDIESQHRHTSSTSSYSSSFPSSGYRYGRTGLDVLVQSAWYVSVSTGALMALVLVLACSTFLLGVHIGVGHVRGVRTGMV